MTTSALTIGTNYLYATNHGIIEVKYIGPFAVMPGGDWHDFAINDRYKDEIITISATSIERGDLRCIGQLITDVSSPSKKEVDKNTSVNKFAGMSIVFSGKFSVLKKELSDIANDNGFVVESNVTKKTAILVVGKYNRNSLKGKDKSIKHLNFENYNPNGLVLSESDFFKLISSRSDKNNHITKQKSIARSEKTSVRLSDGRTWVPSCFRN